MAEREDAEPVGPSRRSLLGLAALLAAGLTTLVAAPVTVLFAAPLWRRTKHPWVPLGPVEEYVGLDGVREARLAYAVQDGWFSTVQEKRVLVREVGPERWDVFSAKCTHVGCGVVWEAEREVFLCPCHGGEFNADGSVKKGPPERALDRLEARRNPATGMLEVREA